MALAECGTHAIVAACPGPTSAGERTLAHQMLARPVAGPGMLICVDRGLYDYATLRAIADADADACCRVAAGVDLPVLRWLPDGSYVSYVAEPAAKRRARARLRDGRATLTDLPGIPVRVVDYEVPGRGRKKEIFTVVTTICDYEDVPAVELAAAYHQRWEIELTEPPRVFRRLHLLGEWRSWEDHRGTTRVSCGNGPLRWCGRSRPRSTPTGCRSPAPSAWCDARSPARRLFPPHRLARAISDTLDEINERPNGERRDRGYPHVVKRARHNSYRVKRRTDRQVTHSTPATIAILAPAALSKRH